MYNNSISARKEAIKDISDYVRKKHNYIFIHYARQNGFSDEYEKGPRIAVIATMAAENEQYKVFSLKKSADILGCDFFLLTENEQDNIEFNMLNEFFEFVKQNKDKIWLHWNMRNNNFGFAAIEDRYKKLGSKQQNYQQFHFEESKLINISVLLKKKYGSNFAKSVYWNGILSGKMYDIFTLNHINDLEILNGLQEIKEYILKNINCIEQSVQGKLKAYKIIMEKTADNALKTRSKLLRDVYGFNIWGIAQYIQDNALLALIFTIIGGVIGTSIFEVISKYFFCF